MARKAIQAMKLQMLIEVIEANEPLERSRLHLGHILEPEVICHERCDLLCILIRKSQPAADLLCHNCTHFHMSVKSNASVRTDGRRERRRLADVMQQNYPRERERTAWR